MQNKTILLPIEKIIRESPRVKSFVFKYKLQAQPGQFLMVWLPGVDEKPISVFDQGDNFMISVANVGDFSCALHNLKLKDKVGFRGPFGTFFTLPKRKGRLIFVAGGYGIVPLANLAIRAKQQGYEPLILKGSRSDQEILYKRIFRKHKIKTYFSTDDGSLGVKGTVGDLFSKFLHNNHGIEKVFICGPEIMEYYIAQLCYKHNLPFQVSIERYMKCGIGVCGSCCVDTTGWRMCVEGPVLDGEKLKKVTEFGKYHRTASGRVEKFTEQYKYTFSNKKIITQSKKQTEKFLEILAGNVLLLKNIVVTGDGKSKINIVDPAHIKEEQTRTGDYFIKLPSLLAQTIPGTVIGPGSFIKELKTKSKKNIEARLLGSKRGSKSKPVFHLTEDCSINIYHGSTNACAIWISEIAARVNAFSNQENCAEHQKQLFKLLKPILKKNSEYNLRIIEVCIASGVTMVGTLTLLLKKRLFLNEFRKIRIDAAIATTAGILTLLRFAKINNINLELNIGYLAYGLSQGQKVKETNTRIYANYVIYPPEILDEIPVYSRKLKTLKAFDGNVYVVGDMGDAVRSLSGDYDKKCPWNKYRNDSYGIKFHHNETQIFNKDKPTTLFLANPGYLLKAFLSCLNSNIEDNQIIIKTKRIWSFQETFDYGILVESL